MINLWITWPLRLDYRLRWDADSLGRTQAALAGQTLRPRMVVLLHDRLAAALGPLAHGLAGLDGVVLEVDGTYGRVHGATGRTQVRAGTGCPGAPRTARLRARRWPACCDGGGWASWSCSTAWTYTWGCGWGSQDAGPRCLGGSPGDRRWPGRRWTSRRKHVFGDTKRYTTERRRYI